MISLRFICHYRSYNSGEVAGFIQEQADALIAAGVAVLNDPVVAVEVPDHGDAAKPDDLAAEGGAAPVVGGESEVSSDSTYAEVAAGGDGDGGAPGDDDTGEAKAATGRKGKAQK